MFYDSDSIKVKVLKNDFVYNRQFNERSNR